MTQGWNRPVSGGQWMRTQEKRINRQERRPSVNTAQDLLGPGFAPTAQRLLDWNSDEATFNGIFYSEPGAVNSPDDTRFWIGTVVSQSNEFGIQRVMEFHLTAPSLTEYVRAFYLTSGSAHRFYSAWATL